MSKAPKSSKKSSSKTATVVKAKAAPARALPGVQTLDVGQLFEMREGKKRPSFVLVDVRTDNERRNVPFEGAQPIDEPEDEAKILSLPKNTKLVFLCFRGIRSKTAAQRFFDLGFTDVASVDGGVEKWVREYGYAAAAAE